MAKVVDITDKLSFDENPIISIKGEKLEIQSNAENMLKILGVFSGGKSETQAAVEAAEMLFNERDMKKIKKMNLQMKDYMILIKEALDIAMDEDDGQGEQ